MMDLYEDSKKNTKRYYKIKKLLKKTYGYDNFKPKQYEIINKIISGNDVCAVLPTGYGKSLTFQIPALYLDKPAIIISPLISLMNDQRIILDNLGITSCCYNSNVDNKAQMRKDILEGKYQFVYITPESIITMEKFLTKLNDTLGLSLIAIDEAHCISSYGHDFRRAYRDLEFIKQSLPKIPILAVTATATKTVGHDICKVLNLDCGEPIKTSFDRPNLYIEIKRKGIISKGNKEKKMANDVIPLIKKYSKCSIIIYCLTKKDTEAFKKILKTHNIKCGIYHSGLNNEKKSKTHSDFLNGKIKIVVATIAFGMGINKSDVRVVIHYGAPKNIEGYYQEIGRAGRDGKEAYCYTFYDNRDFKIQEMFISQSNDPNYQKVQMRMLEKMRSFIQTKQCRRQLLLDYFDEVFEGNCNLCDNCCGVTKLDTEVNMVEQNIRTEAKLLIDLIEFHKDRNFGITMYINILRGSNNKNIPTVFKKSHFYGAGKKKSSAWWKELAENLINLGYLQQISVKGKFIMQVLKVTEKGITWASMIDLSGILDQFEYDVTGLETIKMVCPA